MSQDTKDVRAEIRAMHEKIQTVSYYELLEIKSDIDDVAIKGQLQKQFRGLAKKWHVDRFSQFDLGPDKDLLQEIFSTINTAQTVLGDPERRAAYDMEISGANTDISSLINAEAAYRKGQAMLSTGANLGAHEQFRIASESNPEDKEYRAHFLYTSFLQLEKNVEGHVLDMPKAKKIYDELNDISQALVDLDWPLAFLGVVALGLKREREAENLFRAATSQNFRNLIAQRQLRILNMRRQAKKGFFAKLKHMFGPEK